MLRTVGANLAKLIARSSRNTITKTTCVESRVAPAITSFQKRNASNLSTGRPTVGWKMPPSLVDKLMPEYRSPAAPTPAPLEMPLSWLNEPKTTPGVDQPAKQAARLIVIRRRKMKKHKRKKLRKRMYFEWAKLRLRRETKKEKEFQQTLIDQVEKAHSFNAEEYVNEKLKRIKLSGKL